MDVPHYRDLFIRGEQSALDRAPGAIESELTGGWTRDHEGEERARRFGAAYFVYSCERRDHPFRAAANLFLSPSEGQPPTLTCVNVIPRESHELSHDEYNAIVGEFAREFVDPVASRLGLEVDLERTSLPISSYFSEDALHSLRTFSTAANKTTGSSHPNDRARWFRFIEQVHDDGGRLDEDVLHSWLTENGWDDQKASRLVSEANFGLGLLAHREHGD